MIARLAYANIMARDPSRLSRYYAELLHFKEIEAHRSPIYVCLDAGGIELGFNAEAAYDLLDIADRKPESELPPLRTYLTFEVDSVALVDALSVRAVELGGRLCKGPYDTYYNARQAVLCDPEGNVFRLNYRKGARTPAAELATAPWTPA